MPLLDNGTDSVGNGSWLVTARKVNVTRHIVAHGCDGVDGFSNNGSFTWPDHLLSDLKVHWIGNRWSALSALAILFVLPGVRCPRRGRAWLSRNKSTVELPYCALFSFCLGWVDVVSLRRHRCFATMMVGNMLLLGETLTEHWYCGQDRDFRLTPKPVFYLSIIVCYVLGVVLYRIAEKKLGASGRHLAPAVVTSFVFYDLVVFSLGGQAELRWNVVRMAPMFGAVNVVATRSMGILPWGNTAHLTQLASSLATFCMGECKPEERAMTAKATVMVVSFVLGAIGGTSVCVLGLRLQEKEMIFDYTVPGCVVAFLLYLGDEVSPPPEPSARLQLPGLDCCKLRSARSRVDLEEVFCCEYKAGDEAFSGTDTTE